MMMMLHASVRRDIVSIDGCSRDLWCVVLSGFYERNNESKDTFDRNESSFCWQEWKCSSRLWVSQLQHERPRKFEPHFFLLSANSDWCWFCGISSLFLLDSYELRACHATKVGTAVLYRRSRNFFSKREMDGSVWVHYMHLRSDYNRDRS